MLKALKIPQNNCQSRGSLWDKAYEDLQNDEKNLVDVFEKLLLSEPEIQTTSTLANGDPSIREKQMSALVAKKLETMKEAQWKLQMGEKSIEVRQQVDRIVKVVEVAKVFITSAANMDPIHAGLPWAGVCMLLPVRDEIPPELLRELIIGPLADNQGQRAANGRN